VRSKRLRRRLIHRLIQTRLPKQKEKHRNKRIRALYMIDLVAPKSVVISADDVIFYSEWNLHNAALSDWIVTRYTGRARRNECRRICVFRVWRACCKQSGRVCSGAVETGLSMPWKRRPHRWFAYAGRFCNCYLILPCLRLDIASRHIIAARAALGTLDPRGDR